MVIPVKKFLTSLALVILLLIPLISGGCTSETINGSGQTDSWEMDYTDFARLEINSGFDAEIFRSDSYSVEITIDKALYEYLRINQRGNTLHIGLKSGYTYANAIRKAIVTLPDLGKLELSGGSKATVSDFTAEHSVDFVLSGTSRVELESIRIGDSSFDISGNSRATGDMVMNNGDFKISGVSTLEITGTGNEIKINTSGASSIKLAGFSVTKANVKLTGDSEATVKVSDLLDVNLRGASDLKYIGDPKLGSISVSGGSTINPQTQ
jgi:hypothetical protein